MDLHNLLQRVLSGETVEIGIFKVYEDFIYTRTKNPDGSPIFNRVIALVYFDEDEDDQPAYESFDGTLESFEAALEAHGAFEMYEDEDWATALDKEDEVG